MGKGLHLQESLSGPSHNREEEPSPSQDRAGGLLWVCFVGAAPQWQCELL